jgi:5-oxoprolinase (ATP-hydrolysing)
MLSATASADVEPGDRFVIETPGGGGFGRKGG